jgi:phospholipid/cholesterol/gamma-HCH transport system substrate-binding protein
MKRGLAGTALAAAVAVIAALVIASRGGPTYTVHALFANVNGLVTTGDVEVAGFNVGSITGINVKMGGYPEVTMSVTDSYRLRRGARAVIELGSLAGQLNRYIALSNGTGPPLPDGATIPLKDTDGPVEIDQFLSALTPKVRTELRDLLHETVHTLNGRGPDIERSLRYSAPAFDQTANLFTDVSSDGQALRTLVARAADGAGELAREPADVKDTIDKLSRLLDVAAGRQSAVTTSLQRLPAAFGTTHAALAELNRSVPTFGRLIVAARPALDAIDPFSKALQTTAPLTVPVFRAALSLVQAFRRHSGAIEQLFAPPLPRTLHDLNVGLHGVDPIFDQLRARAPDVLGWIPLLGDAAADYNANGHGWLVLAYPRPAPQKPITPPDCGSGWLLRPFDRIPGQLACDPWTDYHKTFVGGAKQPTSYLTAAQQAPYPGEFP